MFARLSPHKPELQYNPIFRFEVRRINRARSGDELKSDSIRLMAVVVAVAVVLWTLMLILLGSIKSNPNWAGWRMLGLLFCGSILASLVVDFVSLSVSNGSINEDKLLGRWDLLRLSLLLNRHIIEGKHAAAQLRVWRTAWIVVSLRVALLILILMTHVLTDYIIGQMPLGEMLTTLLPFCVLGAVFLLEPLWHLQAMTALGMAVSIYTESGLTTILLSVVAIFVVWVMQIIAIVFLGGMIAVIFGGTFGSLFSSFSGPPIVPSQLCISFPLSAAMAVVAAISVRELFMAVKSWSLERVMRRLIVE